MAVDPRIALAGEPVKMTPFSELMRTKAAFQANQQTSALNDIRIQQETLDNQLKQNQLKVQEEDSADDTVFQEEIGSYGGDWTKTRDALAKRVRPRNLKRYEDQHETAVKNWSALKAEERKKISDDNKAIGDALIGVSIAQPQHRQALWSSERARLAQEGRIDPAAIPEEVPDEDGLKAHIAKVGGYRSYIDTIKKEADSRLVTAKEEAQRAVEDRKETASLKEEFYQKLVTQGKDITQEKYDTLRNNPKYAKIAEDIPATIANPKTGRSAANTLEDIRRGLLTAQQAGAEADKAADNALNAEKESEYERHNLVAEAAARIRAARASGQSAASIAADRKALQKELFGLKTEEEKKRRLRSALEVAIKSEGKQYVNRFGETIPMAAAINSEPEGDVQGFVERMKVDYQNLTSDLKRVTHDKNLAGEALGGQVGVSTEKIHAALDEDEDDVIRGVKRGSKKAASPAPGTGTTPSPGAAAAGVGKPAGMSPQADPSIKERNGYRVGGQYETKDGRKFTIQGFTKDGKVIPKYD